MAAPGEAGMGEQCGQHRRHAAETSATIAEVYRICAELAGPRAGRRPPPDAHSRTHPPSGITSSSCGRRPRTVARIAGSELPVLCGQEDPADAGAVLGAWAMVPAPARRTRAGATVPRHV